MARVELRPATDDDRAFLREVYGTTRIAELAQTKWTEEQKTAFLDHQFAAQDRYYKESYDNATFEVVLINGTPAGRLYVARWKDEIRITDIALLPAFRGQGVGSRLLAALLNEAAASRRRVNVHVEMFNPAMRLYERLGFVPTERRDPYVLMEWAPEDDSAMPS